MIKKTKDLMQSKVTKVVGTKAVDKKVETKKVEPEDNIEEFAKVLVDKIKKNFGLPFYIEVKGKVKVALDIYQV